MMANRSKVTLRAQWLGKLLKELRDENGMTLKDPADHVQRSTATLSRYEAGTLPTPRHEVEELMNLYGVDGVNQRTLMLRLAEEITETGWWDRYAKDISQTIDYVWLESRSKHIRSFTPAVISGLLQTPRYAETVISVWEPHESKQQTERWLSIRMTRQEILEGDEPTHLSALIDEAALRRPVGGPEVMVEQFQHLRKMAERPNIDVRILPFAVGAYPNPASEFTLFRLADPFPEVVHIDSAAGTIFLERDDITRIADLYDRLKASCLNAHDSVAMIAAAEKELA